jgi:hypothetical protein
MFMVVETLLCQHLFWQWNDVGLDLVNYSIRFRQP